MGKNYEITVEQSYELVATQEITLTVGGSSITIAPDGITIEAPMVTVNGDTIVTING